MSVGDKLWRKADLEGHSLRNSFLQHLLTGGSMGNKLGQFKKECISSIGTQLHCHVFKLNATAKCRLKRKTKILKVRKRFKSVMYTI